MTSAPKSITAWHPSSIVGNLFRQQRGYSKVSASSTVPSNRQYPHTGEAVGILGQQHRIAIQTDLAEA